MDCPSDASSWYWLAIIFLLLVNWWLFGKWKEVEQFVPDFYDSEDEVSKHRKRQKRRERSSREREAKEKLEKAREERARRISASPPVVTVQRSADGKVTTTVSPPEEVSWEQDDSIGLVPVEEDDDVGISI